MLGSAYDTDPLVHLYMNHDPMKMGHESFLLNLYNLAESMYLVKMDISNGEHPYNSSLPGCEKRI